FTAAQVHEERQVEQHPVISWTENGRAIVMRWRSERGAPPPQRVVIADDRMTADAAYGLACQGTALLWRGDFQNARQMLVALASRVDRKSRKRDQTSKAAVAPSSVASFNL